MMDVHLLIFINHCIGKGKWTEMLLSSAMRKYEYDSINEEC